jgi:hypothetical protein
MARISYDGQTAAAFKAVREVPRDGLAQWREAIRPHLRPSPGMIVADIGAGPARAPRPSANPEPRTSWLDLLVLR